MPLATVGLWLLNLALDTLGQVAFKAAARASASRRGLGGWSVLLRHRLVGLGLLCYGIEFVTWLAFLTLVPLSLAVLLASVNVVAVMLAGRLLFHEKAGALRTTGILLIAAGVAVVGLGA